MKPKARTKKELLSLTHCIYYVWTGSIDLCPVTKKALKNALRTGKRYYSEITEGKYEAGAYAGKSHYSAIILI